MQNLKVNKVLFWGLALLLTCCKSTQVFEMQNVGKNELSVIEVDSNRIIQECYFMNAEKENNWRHQYILNILNDKNEVIPVYYPVNQDDFYCLAHLKKVEKILKKSSRMKLCVRDKLEKITDYTVTPIEIHDFGSLGKHESPYHALTFDTICNSSDCVSISDTWIHTCPGFPKSR
jgi:hypothetical protein